jgi:hypothetical protein
MDDCLKDRCESCQSKLEYALGALRVIVADDCDKTAAKAFAQAAIDLITLGEDGCAQMRGEATEDTP